MNAVVAIKEAPVDLVCCRCARNIGPTDNSTFIELALDRGVWCSEHCIAESVGWSWEKFPKQVYRPNDDGTVTVTLRLEV